MRSRLAAVASVTALASLAATTGQASAAPVACTSANDIEAIIDDSGSMVATDAGNNRVEAMKLLIQKQSNAKRTLGAVEFGTEADTLFKPALIGQAKQTMLASLANIQADNDTTNYNAAFDLANADNPHAQARIFLTDGGHNEGDYANGHLGGGKPRTFVIGFGSSTIGADGARLQQIATDTGGQYFPQTDSSNLVSVMNQIDAAISCLAAPVQLTHTFTKPNQVKTGAVRLARSTHSVQIVSSYPAGTQLAISVAELKGRQVVAARKHRHKRKIGKLRITRSRGDTFLSLQVRGIKPGLKLRLRIKAVKLGPPTPEQMLAGQSGTVVKTQVTQSRTR